MLLDSTAPLRKRQIDSATISSPTASALPASVAPGPATRLDLPAVPFARLPHSIAADTRLTPTDRLLAAAVLHWACDRAECWASNAALGDYLGVSPKTVERGLQALAAVGYLALERVRPTPANMTGRVLRLCWIEDPTILPAPPSRSRLRVVANLGSGSVASTETQAATETDPTPETTPVLLEKAPTPVSHPPRHWCRGKKIVLVEARRPRRARGLEPRHDNDRKRPSEPSRSVPLGRKRPRRLE